MKINRNNYESFFLDYLEGNLDERHIDQFLDFLEKNPDLKEELHLFEDIQLPREKAVFTGKETLYKPAPAENESFELKAVAYMEGDLKDKERLAFTAILDRNPSLEKEYSLFEKTRLRADTTIRYPNKEKLYRKAGTVLLINWLSRAAAVLVLLLGIYTLFQTADEGKTGKETVQVASVKEPGESPQEAVEEGKERGARGEVQGAGSEEQGENTKEIVESPQQSAEKEVEEKEALASNSVPANSSHNISSAEENNNIENAPEQVREQLAVEQIEPLMARLEEEPEQLALAVSHAIDMNKINDPRNIVTLDEYLASRAKKATSDGVLSVHKIIRAGLNVASELSGDRLGYKVKNGKVTSLDFESKLLAFELPLEKK